MPSRRQYLAAIAGGYGILAGCGTTDSTDSDADSSGGGSPDGSAGGDGTEAPSGTNGTESSDGSSNPDAGSVSDHRTVPDFLELQAIAVRKNLWIEKLGYDHVEPAQHVQYVLATLQTSETIDVRTFELEADHRTWDHEMPLPVAAPATIAGMEGYPVTMDSGKMLLVFPVASPLRTSEARIRYSGTDGEFGWDLADRHLDRLAVPEPAFELAAFDVPDSVVPEERVTVRIRARNRRNRADRFVAVLDWPTELDHGDRQLLVEEVGPGEAFERTLEIYTAGPPRFQDEMVVTLDGLVAARRRVAIER